MADDSKFDEAVQKATDKAQKATDKAQVKKERGEPIRTSLKATYGSVHFFQEMWRVRWMLVAAVGIVAVRAYGLLPEESVTLKTMYRPAIGAMGFIFGHIAYQQAFPWINMRELLYRALAIDEFEHLQGDIPARAVAIGAYIGSAILRGAIYAAFVFGCIMAV